MKITKYEEFLSKYEKYVSDNSFRNFCNEEFNYQPELTSALDSIQLQGGNLSREQFYEIVLWKLNRFPVISDDLLKKLDALKGISAFDKESESLLIELLSAPGISLPMASTILRFLNPQVFQIVDDRAFRVVQKEFPDTLKVKYRVKPFNLKGKAGLAWINESVDIYSRYLRCLRELFPEPKDFFFADRILYLIDKKEGNLIGK